MPKPATPDYPIHDLLRERWSPWAFADRPVSADALRLLFEAARWAPSSSNEQPWRFIVGSKDIDPATWEAIFGCLNESNQLWASTVPVLALGVARRTFARNGSPNPYALYDTGQAVGCLLMEAGALGLHVHQMGGYDREKAREVFAIPEDFEPVSAIAIGYEGTSDRLSTERLRERHDNPARERRSLRDIVFTGASAFGEASPILTAPSAE